VPDMGYAPRRETRRPLPAVVAFTLESSTRDEAAYARRRRHGVQGPGKGSSGTMPVEARNGLPELVPYTYRGSGADLLAGSYGDPKLDAPYWDGRP
jgi:hypothetical protein